MLSSLGSNRVFSRGDVASSSGRGMAALPPVKVVAVKAHRHQGGRGGANVVVRARDEATTKQFVGSSQALIDTDTTADDSWFFNESGQRGWVDAMELNTMSPEMPELLVEMGIKYDPQRLKDALADSWPQVYGRALSVSTRLGGFITAIASDMALGRVEINSRQRAVELRNLLSGLGPSFVKIGQALSARPDLLPLDYLEVLSGLQDRLPSFPNEIAFALIEEELGRPVKEMFSEISAKPVAAASLGQVYKGRLHTGEWVAIKVQRPNIGDSIAVDMLLLRRLMKIVDTSVSPALKITQTLVPLVDEFAGRLFAELDYIAEGKNCEKFSQLYSDVARVRTPGIFWPYSSRRVLTMEWIEGIKLTNKAEMDAAGLSVVDFVNVGIECTLRQLLDHGYFHADPHPGNLLATQSGDLVYLDFGCMSNAPQYARYAIIEHVVHLVNRDYDAMCRDYYTLEFMDRSVDTTPIAPALAAFFDDVLDQSVSQLNFKAIVDGLGDVLFRFPFRVPAYYALILRSLTVLEGLALTADPNYKLLARAYPYMASRLLTDPAPELRASFEELIIKDGAFRWSRLENLVRESSKSQFFDPTQMWQLADWLLSPGADRVRGLVVAEIARMVDATAAADVRANVQLRLGEPAADSLVPVQPAEEQARTRAALLMGTVAARVQNVPGVSGLKGSGPFGLATPGDVTDFVAQMRGAALDVWPRLEPLMRAPGAQRLVAELNSQLARRFAARSIKFVFGAQQQVAGLVGARVGGGAAPPPAAAVAAPVVVVVPTVMPPQQTGGGAMTRN
ncbi:hypothetical protein FOA52_007548 [Chlamydomonas sp. UWO 241]|nr:hypothetical protein FOA52_007548 [Chlamydomonas sp. UWO 241]